MKTYCVRTLKHYIDHTYILINRRVNVRTRNDADERNSSQT